MPLASSISLPARSDPPVRTIARAWRRLTGGTTRGSDRGRRTLIACSGGGDSCGLVLALAAAVSGPGQHFVVAHIVHDLRPSDQALQDRDAAAGLAAGLGLPFVEASIRVKAAGGNPEAAARRLRYQDLRRLAREQGCPYLATAHHAQDQLESIVMGLLRGSGPRGLAGIAPRGQSTQACLIRPALDVCRADLQRLCRGAGWVWCEDATNADQSRLRAAVRHQIAPALERLRPGAAARAARSASVLRDAAGLIQDRADFLLAAATPSKEPDLIWARPQLRFERAVVLGAVLQTAAARLSKGRDSFGWAVLDPVIRAIRSRSGTPHRFQLRGIEVMVDSNVVQIRAVTRA